MVPGTTEGGALRPAAGADGGEATVVGMGGATGAPGSGATGKGSAPGAITVARNAPLPPAFCGPGAAGSEGGLAGLWVMTLGFIRMGPGGGWSGFSG
jgi:hypothetical protein